METCPFREFSTNKNVMIRFSKIGNNFLDIILKIYISFSLKILHSTLNIWYRGNGDNDIEWTIKHWNIKHLNGYQWVLIKITSNVLPIIIIR